FVYHKHGGSFGSTREQLIKANLVKLKLKHPNYQYDINQYIQLNPLDNLRKILLFKLFLIHQSTQLIIDHGLGGGASKYLLENLLAPNLANIIISAYGQDQQILIQLYWQQKLLTSFKVDSLNYFTKHLLIKHRFGVIQLNHSLSIKSLTELEELLINHGQIINYYMHDFFAICPSYTLLNYQGNYCGAETDLNKCNHCHKHHSLIKKQLYTIEQWRNSYRRILNLMQTIYCFSEDSRQHLLKIYPETDSKIIVKAHQIKTPLIRCTHSPNFTNRTQLVIGVLGAIDYAKGRVIIEQLVKYKLFKQGVFKLVIIGYTDLALANCYMTGPYNPQQLSSLIKQLAIDIFILPSIWPETFCYTAEEIMTMCYPLIAFKIGAPSERIINYPHGYLCTNINALALYKQIQQVAYTYGWIDDLHTARNCKDSYLS
ncbi:MAG: hypothetical protein RLZZ293_738, partial [Pseudomonadota bacterium]